jgi:transposase
MADVFWFSDAQWERIEPLLPMDVRGMERVDDRRVLSGIVHALKCGGGGPTVRATSMVRKRRSATVSCAGPTAAIWERIFAALAGDEDVSDRLFIDSSCIKVHRCAGGAKGGPWPMVSAAPRAAATPSSTPSATRKGALSSCS